MEKYIKVSCFALFMSGFLVLNAQAGWLDDLKKANETIKEVKKMTKDLSGDQKKPIKKTEKTIPANKAFVFESEKATKKQTSATISSKSKATAKNSTNKKTVHSSNNIVKVFAPGMTRGQQSFGQARLMGSNGAPVYDNGKGLLPVQQIYAKIYLKYYPEVLNQDAMVESYAHIFFSKDARIFLNSGPNVFEKRRKIEEWRQRLIKMPKNPPNTFQYYFPIMFDGRYDFSKKSFPMGVAFPFNMTISSGVAELTCLELNQEFSLSELKIPENDAESFLERNKSNVRTSSIFVGLRFKITGKSQKKGVNGAKCKLAVHVEAIEGFEYRNSGEKYNDTTAKVGRRIKSWLSANSNDARIEKNNRHKVMASNIPKEAQDFKLATKKGMILIPTNYGVSSQQQREAFAEYADFLQLGISPKTLDQYSVCYARTYLEQGVLAQYMDKRGLNWLGTTSFERDRNKAAFIKKEGAILVKRSVKLPQKFIVVSKVHLQQYDKRNQGYLIAGLSERLISGLSISPPCSRKSLKILPTAEQISDFWKIDPVSAEKMLNSLEKSKRFKRKKFNIAYLESIVTLSSIDNANIESNPRYIINPPLKISIESTTIYADIALSKKLYSPKIIRANNSVMETGVPKQLKVEGNYPITERDYFLLALKHKGDIFDQYGWQELTAHQSLSDRNYYANISAIARRAAVARQQYQSVANSLDPSYLPFYPKMTEIIFDKMSKKQQQQFKKWMKLRASSFPSRVTYRTQLRWHQATATTNLELGIYGKRIALPSVIAKLGIKKNQIFYPVGGVRYRDAPVVSTSDGDYTVIYAFPKALNQYAQLSKAEIDRLVEKMGHPSSVGNAKLQLEIKKVRFLKDKEQGYMLIEATPTKLGIYDHAYLKSLWEWEQ